MRFALLSARAPRRVLRERSLKPPDTVKSGEEESAVYTVVQRGSEREILDDNTGGALYDAAIVLSRYLAAKEAEAMQGKTVLVIITYHLASSARSVTDSARDARAGM